MPICPRVVVSTVSTAAFHARVRGSFPGIGGLEETKMFPLHRLLLSIVGSLRDREVGTRPPGFEFRILCLEGSVMSLLLRSFFWPNLACMCIFDTIRIYRKYSE